VFDPEAAKKLLEDNGWVKGPDGVRSKNGQRLEFEYSTAPTQWRLDTQAIIQRNLRAIGIRLDIQNYPPQQFFGSILPAGKASPPTGAVAERYDIAEFAESPAYDPDDSSLLSCDQRGTGNLAFYCNPALDVLLKQEQTIVDPGVRQQIFTQIHQILLTEFPIIVLYSTPAIAMVRKGTHNYQVSDIDGEFNIWEWWCDNGKC
jgi:peptide/nickel transport system substrate-binding protein